MSDFQIVQSTPWAYDTSEEDSETIAIFAGGTGKLYFSNELTGQKMVVKYDLFSVGTGKGAVFNVASSVKEDPSSGFSNVHVKPGYYFGPESFPVTGWMEIIGITAGVFMPSFSNTSGAALVRASFGFRSWGAVKYWGLYKSILPSAGASLAFCHYSLDK